MDKRDKWENIVKSKLENFEAATFPEDWNAILGRLPLKKRIISFYTWRYAAAVAAIVLLLSGGYFFYYPKEEKPVIADIQQSIMDSDQKKEVAVIENEWEDSSTEEKVNNRPKQNDIVSEELVVNKQNVSLKTIRIKKQESENQFIEEKLSAERIAVSIESQINNTYAEIESIKNISGQSLLAEVTPTYTKKRTKKRWGVGMGSSAYSIGTEGITVPDFTSPSNLHSYEGGLLKESANSQKKQDISHKKPISFGVGVGYAINERWSLQSGLYYTMLRSEWWYVDEYQGVSKQKLHYLGVPLGISYKIWEWKKFNLYASAGGMTEWNFNGEIKTNFYQDSKRETVTASKGELIRMKEWQWSVNGKVGISYPLIKFVNAFVEGGANYYFDNGSAIETIRSDKPFHMSFQAGIRLGF